jgi:hypothetical protein
MSSEQPRSSPTADLGRAIDAYVAKDGKLGEAEKAMLALLRVSEEVTEAFAGWQLPEGKTFTFIHDCIEAYRLANGGHAKQVEAYRSAPDPEQARKALAEVARFFRGSLFETIPDPPHVPEAPNTWEEFASCRTYIVSADQGPLGEAIAVLSRAINNEERYREEYRWFSQKGDVTAADSRAIANVKESVFRLTG